jgi:hypothetical protein
MQNKTFLKLVIFIFANIIFTSCNIKYGLEDSKEFYYIHKADLVNLSQEFQKFSNLISISSSDIVDSNYKKIAIERLNSDEVKFINEVRLFLKKENVLNIEKSHNNKLILFYLGTMDGIAYKVNKDSYIDLSMAFANSPEIEQNWYYFLNKTI